MSNPLKLSLFTSQPLIQHRPHRLHDLPHHVRLGEQLHKEALVLLIAGGGHIGKVLLKEQHKGLAVVVLGVAMPLVLGGIVVFQLEQHLVQLREARAVLLVDLLNDHRQRVALLFLAACLAGDGPEAFLGARQLDGAFEVLFQPVILQKHLVVHLYRLMAALGQEGSEKLGVYAEFVNLPVKEPAHLRDKGIDAVEPRQG